MTKWLEWTSIDHRIVSTYRSQTETFRLDCDPGFKQSELTSLCRNKISAVSVSCIAQTVECRRTDFEDHKRARLTYSGLPTANTRRSRLRSIWVARNIQWLCTRESRIQSYTCRCAYSREAAVLVLRRNTAGLYGFRKRPLLGLSLPASVALSMANHNSSECVLSTPRGGSWRARQVFYVYVSV